MGLDPSSIQNPKFLAALKEAQKTGAKAPDAKVYTVSAGLFNASILKQVSVRGTPLGKPRMTRRDQWQKRDCVVRYRDYCDRIRRDWIERHGGLPGEPDAIMVVAFMPVTPSWSKKQQEAHLECGHRLRPDGDNILKSVCDALFPEDSCLWLKVVAKFWCAIGSERTDISVLWYT